MRKGKENTQGRGLEYAFIEAFVEIFPDVSVDSKRVAWLKSYFDCCELSIQSKFRRACRAFWKDYGNGNRYQTVKLGFFSDSQAPRKGVTDLNVTLDESSIRISVKHNHTALRHPRIPATVWRMGFPNNSSESQLFRARVREIRERSRVDIFERFGRVPDYEHMGDWKFSDLYRPLLQLLDATYNEHGAIPEHAQKYLEFLWGGDHVKAVVGSNSVVLYDYRDIAEPKRMWSRFDPHKVDSLILSFDTGLEIGVRLHNDRRSFEDGPLEKLDIQPIGARDVIRETFF